MSNLKGKKAELSKLRVKQVKENTQAITRVNANVKVDRIEPEEEDSRKYYCTACGKKYLRQSRNFSKTKSPLYAGNNGYVTICRNCVDVYFVTLTNFFDSNEEKAIERFCQIFDWYYDVGAVAAAKKTSSNRSRISSYPSKLNLGQVEGETYLDTIKDRFSEYIESAEEFKLKNKAGEISVSDKIFERWGIGFSDDELLELDRHYKMLKELQISGDDVIQDLQIRSACEQHIMKLRIRDKDTDKYIKLCDSYNKSLEKAGLKSKANLRDNMSDGAIVLGKWIDDIEKYCPADYYKDKAKYHDFFNIKEYAERFILRPLKNFLLGTKEKDFEFNIDDFTEVDSLGDEDG